VFVEIEPLLAKMNKSMDNSHHKEFNFVSEIGNKFRESDSVTRNLAVALACYNTPTDGGG
jgi:hypothetical protein